MLLQAGLVLADRYKIEKVLGQGGMGAVYLASDARIPEKLWAVKELWDYGDPATRNLIQNQFKTEASILATLDHPNLPRITDFFVEKNEEYLVMDYVEGRTLEEILLEADGPLDTDLLIALTRQLIDVIEYLHSEDPPVIFRDLKPANIMVSDNRKIKLIDFGIARIFTAGKQKDTVVMGTPGYAAPEQYGTRQSDPRSDLYGLGATLYYCITGQDPADNPFHFDSPSDINAQAPKRLCQAVIKCVQMEVDDRFQSAGELRNYLFGEDAHTEDISVSMEGTRSKKAEKSDSDEEVTLEPSMLDLGTIKRGKNIKRHFIIKGNVSHIKVSSNHRWCRVYPSLADGEDVEIEVTIYTGSLNHGGKYNAQISLEGEDFSKVLPLSVEIEPSHMNFLTYVISFISMLVSLVPVIGFFGFLVNLISYVTVPIGERKSLKIFFYISLFITLLYLTVAVLYFGIVKFGWFGSLKFN